MKVRDMSFVWGILLILGGALALAQNFGLIGDLSPQVWLIVFSALSLLFFATYLLAGFRQWGWLFPATIFAGLAVTLGLVLSDVSSAIVGAPVVGAVAVPFFVAFALDTRKNWWALIPAYAISVITLITIVVDRVPGEAIGAVFMMAIALPFLVVFGLNRTRWWALIPGIILAVLGFVPLLTSGAGAEYVPSFVMFGLALPFLVIYLLVERAWWALIPAGVLASIGVASLVGGLRGIDVEMGSLMGGLLFGGWALTFFVLWLRRSVHGTGWAKWPAAVLAAIAVLSLAALTNLSLFWPILLIAGGLVVLFAALRPKPQV